MSEPIDTSRSAVERERTALTSTINVHLALDVDLFADRVRALLDERDVLNTKNYDLETEMIRHRVTSRVRLEGLTTWKEVADLHRERAQAAEKMLAEAASIMQEMKDETEEILSPAMFAFAQPKFVDFLARYNESLSRTTSKSGTWSVPAANTGLRLGTTESEDKNA